MSNYHVRKRRGDGSNSLGVRRGGEHGGDEIEREECMICYLVVLACWYLT
jgi:hypothetical protein